MSSSIEEYFQPPEWATKEEVIKAAQHYINYWKIEAKQRNQQWLNALEENARLKAEVERLTAMANENTHLHKGIYSLSLNVVQLKAEVERLRASSFVTAVPVEQYERLRKAGDAMASALILFEMKSEEERQDRIKAWSAAKEGKQP